MNNDKDSFLEVKDFYQKTKDSLRLKPASTKIGFSRKRRKNSLSIQVWGKNEIQELGGFSSKKREELLRKRLENDIFCIILADGLHSLPEIEEEAKRRKVALFSSDLSKKRCQEEIKKFFSSLALDQITISGGLLQIFGLGVLVTGDSSIGKSESALELVSRGHHFISDDVVRIKKNTVGRLVGEAPDLARYFMEIRGLGIINIKEIFGLNAICKQTEINLTINLERWQQGKEYDRLGLKFPEDYKILGQKIPRVNIPVAPGRNIATLIEVACKMYILKEKGYQASQEIIRKLNRALSIR